MAQQNLELGPCRVSVNDTDVGSTVGPVRIGVVTHWRDRRSDLYGALIVDRVSLGVEVRVTCRLAEKTLANLQRVLPHVDEQTGYLGLGRSPGFKAGSAAQSLRLSPEERSDGMRDVLLHKAVATGVTEIVYGPGRDRAFDVEFVAMVDPSKDNGDLLARFYQGD